MNDNHNHECQLTNQLPVMREGSSALSNNSKESPPSVAWPGGVWNTLSSDLQLRGERCASVPRSFLLVITLFAQNLIVLVSLNLSDQ